MSQYGTDFPDIKSINAKLFPEADPNVLKDNEYMERVQRNCTEQVNPLACYLTILLGKEPRVTWRHNTANHFGIVDLQFEDLLSLIHPSWRFTYVHYGRIMYEVTHKHWDLFMEEGATAARLVPLRHRSGKYYWYHQLVIKVAGSGENIAAHLNYYQQSSPYAGQLPEMPQMMTSGEVNKLAMEELNRLALEILPDFLSHFLSEAQVKFMLQYRKVISDHGGEKMVRGALLKQIKDVDTLDNLNKLQQRIRLNVTDFFQHPSLDSAYSFALWLNRYFPLRDD